MLAGRKKREGNEGRGRKTWAVWLRINRRGREQVSTVFPDVARRSTFPSRNSSKQLFLSRSPTSSPTRESSMDFFTHSSRSIDELLLDLPLSSSGNYVSPLFRPVGNFRNVSVIYLRQIYITTDRFCLSRRVNSFHNRSRKGAVKV